MQELVRWGENNSPYSERFGDIYFNPENGLAESNYVFIKQNNLRERFASVDNYFVIAELGFGTGLNFLATYKLWREVASANSCLHFISYERYPLTIEQIKHALLAFPELADEATELLRQYPACIAGIHRMTLKDNITLTLVIGDANLTLKETVATVDAWFLDGFAPQKNPELWSEEIFSQIARLSKANTTLATFSAASIVKERARKAGFEVEKVKGFANKREMLKGVFSSTSITNFSTPKSALVIGAGVAGCFAAACLARRRISVALIDQQNKPANEASGNPWAEVQPYIALKANSRSELYTAAFSFFKSQLAKLKDIPYCETIGTLQLPASERIKKLFESFSDLNLSLDFAQLLNAAEASDLSQVKLNTSALFLPQAVIIQPGITCQRVIEDNAINFFANTKIDKLYYDPQAKQWIASSVNTEQTFSADMLVLATAWHKLPAFLASIIELYPLRGQLCWLEASAESRHLKTMLSYDGYLMPAVDGRHLLGTSYEHGVTNADYSEDVAEKILTRAKHWCHSLESARLVPQTGRVAFRAFAPDKLPLIGKSNRYPNLYTTLAHGSHGFLTSPLAGELIACLATGEPLPLAKSVLADISPDRF